MRKWLEGFEDRRRSPRNPGDGIVAHYWTGGAPAPRRVDNVSLDGAYIQAPDLWHAGTVITLTFQLDAAGSASQHKGNGSANGGPPPLAVRAVVVRSGPDGFGVRFLVMDHRERAGLRKFLEHAAAVTATATASAPEPNAGPGWLERDEYRRILPCLDYGCQRPADLKILALG